jgi:hypothetical protein
MNPKKARRKLDKKFLTKAAALERAVKTLSSKSSRKLILLVKQYSDGEGNINELDKLYRAISDVLDDFFSSYSTVLNVANTAIIKAKIADAISVINPKLNSAGLQKQALKFAEQLSKYGDSMPIRFQYQRWAEDGVSLDERIKTLRKTSEKNIRRIITRNVQNGRGATQISREIRQYVNPSPNVRGVRPLKYNGRDRVSGSIRYNSLRIARTETAYAYRTSTLDFYKDKPWVKGYRWVISGSHPRQDDCDTFAAKTYKDIGDVPARSHPNCLCDVQPIIMTAEEMKNL